MADAALIGPLAAPDLHVMSFNIRRRMPKVNQFSPDLWPKRKPAIRALLELERPAILGLQECLPSQTDWVSASLGRHYEHLGYGRNADHSGEQTPLFWDTRRLRLVSWAQVALSDTPDAPGSRSWGNRTPRMAVVAQFDVDGTRLRVINTHFDDKSRTARLHSAREVAILAEGMPTIVTGDFNSSVGTGPYRELTIGAALADTWVSASTRLTEDWGSFPDYKEPRLDRKRIDWVLASPSIEVVAAAINPYRLDGVAASDHLPVQAVVRLVGNPSGG